MISRYEVTLNGISMESLHPDILITDVMYEQNDYEKITHLVANRQGSRVTSQHKEKASVTITFQIRAYDIADRQTICQSIISWARDGGDLRINDRPGKMLACVCDKMPYVSTVRGWTEELSITFAAYAIPYWQDVVPTVVTFTTEPGTSDNIAITVPGNAPRAYISTTIDGMVGDVTVPGIDYVAVFIDEEGTGSRPNSMIFYMRLAGTAYNKLVIDYDENAVQKVTVWSDYGDGEWSINDHAIYERTGPDDILTKCGTESEYSFVFDTGTSQLPVTVTLSARGLWE